MTMKGFYFRKRSPDNDFSLVEQGRMVADSLHIRQNVEELRSLVGLGNVKKTIGGFSRGMKQRLGIAQALLTRPKLLICDEPTSALDPVGRKEILDILRRLIADNNLPLIGPQQAEYHFHGRCFSGSVLADEPENTSLRYGHIQIVNDLLPAEGF